MPMNVFFSVLFFLTILLGSAVNSFAHEFWIEASEPHYEVGDQLQASLRVGQDLKGNSLSYLPGSLVRFTQTLRNETTDVEGRIGDNPAINLSPQKNGLHIFAYQSTPDILTYNDFSQFEGFVDYDGLDGTIEKHRSRGLPDNGFREAYTRYAKALVKVGDADSENDQLLGLELELVAQENPYRWISTNPGKPLPLRLFSKGKPIADIQIATFQRFHDDRFSRTITRSDSDGRAAVEIEPGAMVLISAVQMVEPQPGDFPVDSAASKTVWHSLWASLSFRLPQE